MIRLMLVLFRFFFLGGGDGEYGSSTVGFGAILGNGHEIPEQNYFELLPGSGMAEGFHYKICILGM